MKTILDKEVLSYSASRGQCQRDALAVDPDAGCNIQFTSGTTGSPKAALLSHHNIVNNGFNIGLRNELHERHTKICVQVPLFHVFGVVVTLSSAVQHGATVVLPAGRYSPAANIEALVTEKCDSVYGTPTMHIDLVNAVRSSGVTGLRVRTAITGGSPVTPKLVQDLERTLGLSCVKSIFGMTEGSAVSFQSLPGEDQERPLYYVGALHDHLEAKIVNDEGNMVPFGAPGELWIRGYSVMTGYWGEKAKTAETKRPDGWLRTGDQVVLHQDGYGQIVGRLKDLIIRGGENIAPKEIEDVLTAHPDVVDCQVVGVQDDRLGEEICAVIRLQEGAALNAQELSRHCQGSLAKYKIPRIFKRIDSFPKTASGKVQKYKLRNMIESGKL
ncbi:Acyl-CoA synthetase family member 2, mitochondrial [Eumeta japonica]|uniref:Medium-chain acyl-CoA ligase ACSF2, mitochondrial n=1 Tax=Eumeta variegata TaxID=151549 RepID=A0A4C1VTP0_EUMVA|nr:Acyl-CoA synthetase family member 2, mitochondrial [Eumeta japonica]